MAEPCSSFCNCTVVLPHRWSSGGCGRGQLPWLLSWSACGSISPCYPSQRSMGLSHPPAPPRAYPAPPRGKATLLACQQALLKPSCHQASFRCSQLPQSQLAVCLPIWKYYFSSNHYSDSWIILDFMDILCENIFPLSGFDDSEKRVIIELRLKI